MQLTYSANLYLSAPLGFSTDPDVIFFTNKGVKVYRSVDKGITWLSIDIDLHENEKIKYWIGNHDNANMIFCTTTDPGY